VIGKNGSVYTAEFFAVALKLLETDVLLTVNGMFLVGVNVPEV